MNFIYITAEGNTTVTDAINMACDNLFDNIRGLKG